MTEYIVISMGLAVGSFVGFFLLILLLLRLNSKKIFGIYPRKGLFYHLKYGIALVVLKYMRSKLCHRKEEEMASLERPQVMSEHPKSYDVVSFMAANVKGEKLLVTLERRRRGIIKACLFLWLPDYGRLAFPKMPDMFYFTTNGEEENTEFKGNGLHIYPKEPMKSWCIKYEGALEQVPENKLFQVKLDLEFTSTAKHFDYNRDLSSSLIADATAREAWNEAFYIMCMNVDKILDNRTHYEQVGNLKGDLMVEERGRTTLNMNCIRDHSFGTDRCLSTINRYVYFSLFLEDGTTMVVGNLSQPSFFLSSLKVGYVCTSQGEYEPITKCNFELYSYGEKGVPPNHQNFVVHTAEMKYFVQIKVEDCAIRYIGGNWESKVYNQFFSCTVNGKQGHGITEYLYRHHGGRPEEVCGQDPEWYQRIRKFERTLSKYEDDDEEFFF
ncbi:uncharacterized protein LOC106093388 [Stomoxys calcitrans]|uniref:uncharacterized protein LOC106093388 n=1 Tax=Stomoxys calcitrans TaxID=35570 RepID=UPI0027E398F6|nr:uncharacterized protein LOC106093388 [Stomoxys calcitrans]